MNTILKILDLTQYHYDMIYLGNYMRWCESVTINPAQLQMVMANASVDKYYAMEYAKCTADFLELIKNYPNANPADAMELYVTCTLPMFNRRCLPVIAAAKKNNINEFSVTNN